MLRLPFRLHPVHPAGTAPAGWLPPGQGRLDTARQAAVEVNGVTVRHGARVVLRDATGRAEPGSLVALVGLNGSGKTTLLKAILGTVRASGAVLVHGEADRRRRRRLIAYVPQREDVEWTFPISVMDAVLMGRLATLCRPGPVPARDREAALAALDRVGMAALAPRPVGELSGGQQQRVALARALFAEAPVMLLDEPLSGVDPTTREVVLRILREACDRGSTVLMAVHDILVASRVADRVWGINRTVVADVPAGRLLDEEVLRDVYGETLIVLPRGRLAIGDQMPQ